MNCAFPTCCRDFNQSSTQGISFHRIPEDMPLLPSMEAHGQTDQKPELGSIVCSNHLVVKVISETKIGDQLQTNPVPDANLKICRICLSTDSKMFSMTCFNLNEAYETLTGISLVHEEQLPRCLCSDCADRLMNCARFRRRSLRAHSVLMDVYKNHGRITVELVQTAKKKHYPLNTDMEDKASDDLDFDDKDLEEINKLTGTENDSRIGNDYMHVDIKKYKPETPDNAFDDDDNREDIKNMAIDEDCKETDNLKDQNVDACFSNSKIGISAKNNEIRDDVSVSFELKTENYGINQDNNNEALNKSEGCTTQTADTVSNGVKMGYIDVEIKGIKFETPSNVSLMSLVEGVIGDPLGTQKGRQQARRATKTSQELNIGKIDQQSPDADGGRFKDTFRCDICPYQTDRRTKLTYHKRKHLDNDIQCNYKRSVQKHTKKLSEEKPYTYEICGETFIQKKLLQSHSKIHPTEKYPCDVCEKVFKKKIQLRYHSVIHSDVKPYSCHVCEKTFSRKQVLKNHVLIHSTEKPYLCEICGKAFIQKDNLKSHLNTHSEGKYSCNVCEKVYKKKSTLRYHLMVHSNVKPYSCNDVKPYSCNDVKPYSCNICQRAFIRKQILQKHVLIHSTEKPHSCEICGKAFIQKAHLQTHLNTHSEGKYSCDVCGKLFKRRTHLGYHLMLHSGEKPHSCNICKKGFRRRDHLRLHLATHSDEKPFTCDICKTGFKTKKVLRVHSTIHSDEKPYLCNICSKSFKLNVLLKKHLLRHTGEKPFSCDICHRKFQQKGHLQTHLLIHSSERPYACDICHKSFKRKQNLNTHWNRLHSG